MLSYAAIQTGQKFQISNIYAANNGLKMKRCRVLMLESNETLLHSKKSWAEILVIFLTMNKTMKKVEDLISC